MGNNINNKFITEEVVRYVARLSRLSLDDEGVSRFQHQLANILEYIEQLNEVDTKDTLPTTHAMSSIKNVFREDELKGSIPLEDALENAPQRHGNFFKVPKVI